jgi:hypothetical protein
MNEKSLVTQEKLDFEKRKNTGNHERGNKKAENHRETKPRGTKKVEKSSGLTLASEIGRGS